MNKVKFTPPFERRIKKLAKKYPRIKNDFKELLKQLKQGNIQGDLLQGFSGRVYKARVASSDQNKGKSGGFRFVYMLVKNEHIYLITAFAKATQENLSNKERQQINNVIMSVK